MFQYIFFIGLGIIVKKTYQTLRHDAFQLALLRNNSFNKAMAAFQRYAYSTLIYFHILQLYNDIVVGINSMLKNIR